MIGGMGDNAKRAMAERMLKREEAESLFGIIAEVERSLVASVTAQHDVLGIDVIDELPDADDRAAQLREMALAKIEGRFPAYVVAHHYDDVLEHAEEAAEYAALDAEEWAEQKAAWADRYRDQGLEGDDDELARAHVRTRYDVDLETFEEIVVAWDGEREAGELEAIATAGLKTAQQGIDRTTATLEAADVTVDVDQDDVVVSDP